MFAKLLLSAVITVNIFITGSGVYIVSIDTPHLYCNFIRYGRHARVSGLLLRFPLGIGMFYYVS